jgi:hypothetical protein
LASGLRLGLTGLGLLLNSFLTVSNCFGSETEPIFPLPVEDAVDIIAPFLQSHEWSGQDPAHTALVPILYANRHTHELRRSASSALCDLSRIWQSAWAMLSSRQHVSSLVPGDGGDGCSLVIIWRRRSGDSQDDAFALLVRRRIQRLVTPISPLSPAFEVRMPTQLTSEC